MQFGKVIGVKGQEIVSKKKKLILTDQDEIKIVTFFRLAILDDVRHSLFVHSDRTSSGFAFEW